MNSEQSCKACAFYRQQREARLSCLTNLWGGSKASALRPSSRTPDFVHPLPPHKHPCHTPCTCSSRSSVQSSLFPCPRRPPEASKAREFAVKVGCSAAPLGCRRCLSAPAGSTQPQAPSPPPTCPAQPRGSSCAAQAGRTGQFRARRTWRAAAARAGSWRSMRHSCLRGGTRGREQVGV